MSIGERVCWFITLLGAFFVTAPFVSEDYMDRLGDGAFALGMVGLMTGLTSFIMVFFYRNRNKHRRRLLAGEGVLARWHYTAEEWREFTGVDLVRESGSMRKLLILVGVIMLLVWLPFAIFDPKPALFVGAILLVVWVLCFIASRVTIAKFRKRAEGPAQEILIGQDALLLGDDLHIWRGWSGRLEGAVLTEGPPLQLQILYSTPTKGGRQEHDVRVPVPAGREAEAQQLVRRLSQVEPPKL
jgi:hypothetical protein